MFSIATIIGKTPKSEKDVAELRAANGRLQAEREKAIADNSRIPEALDRAVLAGDDESADKLEAKRAANVRLIRRHELAGPILARCLFEAEETMRNLLIAKHRPKALERLDGVVAAMIALTKASAAANEAFEAAAADMGRAAAAAYTPSGAWNRMTPEMIEARREGCEIALGRRLPVYPDAPSGIEVVMLMSVFPLIGGDHATVPDAVAHAMVRNGAARYAEPQSVVVPIRPHDAEPPKPDINGYVSIVIIRSTASFRLIPRDEAGAHNPGDIASFPLGQAVRLVRGGYAEFLPAAAAESLVEDES